MPCRPDETFAQGPEPPNPVMPTDSTGNDGAGHADPDAENSDSESDLEAQQKQKRARTVLAYEVVQRWVTGDRAELTEQEIQAELFSGSMQVDGTLRSEKVSLSQSS